MIACSIVVEACMNETFLLKPCLQFQFLGCDVDMNFLWGVIDPLTYIFDGDSVMVNIL